MGDLWKRFELTGRVAVVTGASEGIGKGLALGLAEAGADVVVCSRSEGKLKEVKAEIEKRGRRSEVCVVDVRRIDEIEKLKDFILGRFDKLDILVNNAGVSIPKAAWEVTEEEWHLMVDTGFKGLFFCSQIIGSIMRKNGYGKIINLSSTFSRSIVPGRAIYASVKAGISHLTEALATEWASEGIRVNAIAPTAVLTPTRKDRFKGAHLERVLNRIPLGRLATDDDLIGAAVYLCSEASDFVTGHTLFVDGGWIAAS